MDSSGSDRLPTFWLLVVTFGIASVGIAGLNLHIFSYVTDIGYSPLIAASFMSTIALTQLGSTLVWGVLADRFDIRKVSCIQFLIQGVGLIVGDHRAARFISPTSAFFSTARAWPAALSCAK